MFKQKRNILRVIDANGNRACEGLRVVEDFSRFVWNDSSLSNRCKQLRHELAECLQHEGFLGMVAMRESMGDVGRTIETGAEYDRTDAADIVKANLTRVQQATRSLEEFAKIFDIGTAKRFEQIRYCVYELESSFSIAQIGHDRLASSALYVLADATESDRVFRKRVASITRPDVDGRSPVDIVQLRDKNVSTQVLIDRCRTFRDVAAADTLLIVNDRPDVASVVQADGVHLGQDDMAVHEARTLVGPEMLVGVSTHSAEQVESAAHSGANYIGVGPTFASTTKTFSEFKGLGLLRSAAAITSLPAFAIGGIDEHNVDQVANAGFRRVAVSAAIWRSSDPGTAARQLRKRLSEKNAIVGDEK